MACHGGCRAASWNGNCENWWAFLEARPWPDSIIIQDGSDSGEVQYAWSEAYTNWIAGIQVKIRISPRRVSSRTLTGITVLDSSG